MVRAAHRVIAVGLAAPTSGGLFGTSCVPAVVPSVGQMFEVVPMSPVMKKRWSRVGVKMDGRAVGREQVEARERLGAEEQASLHLGPAEDVRARRTWPEVAEQDGRDPGLGQGRQEEREQRGGAVGVHASSEVGMPARRAWPL